MFYRNMLIWILLLVAFVAITGLMAYKFFMPDIVRKKAYSSLYKVLFPGGEEHKAAILKTFHDFTNNRFSDEEILDYFVKIKGLQSLSSTKKMGFWVKKHLMSPTEIKLNYFEQVKFYKLFINYPSKQSKKRKPDLSNAGMVDNNPTNSSTEQQKAESSESLAIKH